MKKKCLIILLSLVCVTVCVFGLVACDIPVKPSGTHTHNYQWLDSGDGTHRQHCSISGCNAPDINSENHVWGTDNKCEKCKAVKSEEEHTHNYMQKNDETYHWMECLIFGCTEKIKDKSTHNTLGIDDACTVCGYKVGGTVTPPVHNHIWSQMWESNETHHWHNCIDDGCTVTDNSQKDGYAEHDFTNGNCVCGKAAPHAHVWSQSWESDETHHWHNCTADGCAVTDNSQKDGYAEHDFTNGNCVCGKAAPHAHVWSQSWESDETHHWHNCTADGCAVTDNSQKDGYAEHDFTNGNCVCGKKDPFAPTEGLKYAVIGGEILVTGIGTATDTDIVIATVYKGSPVTGIKDRAFKGCDITSITIPNSVASIGDEAFYGCSNLTSITIPDSVTSIGDEAFYGCSSLTSITIPDSVTSIGDAAFSGCSSLKSITIIDGVTSIGSSAFKGCSNLTSITIPDGVTSIGDETFYGCSSLISITIPDSVTSIGVRAFRGCNITSITIPDSVTSIGYEAFYGCSSLTSITIPDSVTKIYSFVFNNCSSLTRVIIPDSITSIGDDAFNNCSSLTSITIPDSVESIGSFVFNGCPIETATIPAIACSSIRNSELKTVVITSGERIDEDAFYNCSSLTSITISDSITSIGRQAFYGCSSLTNVIIPESITSIGILAFFKCSSLTCIIIPRSVTNIHSSFGYCSSLTSITIPDSVESIDSSAFNGCPIETATIPAIACSSIRNSELKTVVITSGERLSESAFYNCSSLTNIIIPDSITSISWQAFYGCSSLTSITFNGTKEQWKAVEKDDMWNNETGNYVVHCSDGDIAKSEDK